MFFTGIASAAESNEIVAELSWRNSFKNYTMCADMNLEVRCVENEISVLCETHPVAKSGDADCYDLLEIISFIPASKTVSGAVEIIGKAQPTW